eukprot:CAMPEP_0180440026 /NCGR_PEP_ID=MMETSP1036_2-20121128/12893_2 /TAXON_ID=632150 /ORGANISM="Azadinium spinosum, Strain 3D9" /LENGTH=74 /DNA_ID=CAMNT_0022446187 /DNA_START=213 /DNA_END=433 /DNA_ORIENTATION=-
MAHEQEGGCCGSPPLGTTTDLVDGHHRHSAAALQSEALLRGLRPPLDLTASERSSSQGAPSGASSRHPDCGWLA